MKKDGVQQAKKKQVDKKGQGMKFGIRAKMLSGILPVVAISFCLLTVISALSSRSMIRQEIMNTALAELNSNVKNVDGRLSIMRNTATSLSSAVGSTYKTAEIDSYGQMITEMLNINDSVLGMGLWFEPKAFQGEDFMGPYWFKNNGKIELTYDYSNAEYDYFSQEYYQNAKKVTSLSATITDPYYDPTSGLVMATCSAPMFNEEGAYIGCVTVDISLDGISEIMSAVKVGKTGTGILTMADGTYIYTSDANKVSSGMNISADTNQSLALAGNKAVTEKNGSTTFTESGKDWTLFYQSVPEVNWELMIRMSNDEIDGAIRSLTVKMIVICVIAILVCGLIIMFFVNSIAASLNKVKAFAVQLSEGNFRVNQLDSKGSDELGDMSRSLNHMYDSNKGVISKISEEAGRVNEASVNLNSMAGELTNQFDQIKENMNEVNEAMMSTGAATQEVSASVEEVDASVQTLAGEAIASSEEAAKIQERAADIEKSSKKAYDNAISIVEKKGAELDKAQKQAEVVNEIGNLADAIAEIASEIDLLSLNASIEAARAGEHGKGFAVVATEINNLANQTSQTVEKIQLTINGVQDAFKTLSESSKALLMFLRDTVTPDYDNFVGVGRQYGEDARKFGVTSDRIADMTNNIRMSMDEVSKAVQNIAESTQETADSSSNVTNSLETVSEVVNNVTDMSAKQEGIAQNLGNIVGEFQL